MRDHHEGQEAFRKLPRGHNQYNIFETTEIKGGEKAGHDRDSIVIPLPYVLQGVVEEEVAIAPIVNGDMSSPLDILEYESDDESEYYYPSSSLVDLDSSCDESLLSQSNIDFVDQLVNDDSDVFNGIADFSDEQ